MFNSRLPCFDVDGVTSHFDGEKSMLKFCQWRGEQVPCSAIFTTVPTDHGMCCSFNKMAAEEIFLSHGYPKFVQVPFTFFGLNHSNR